MLIDLNCHRCGVTSDEINVAGLCPVCEAVIKHGEELSQETEKTLEGLEERKKEIRRWEEERRERRRQRAKELRAERRPYSQEDVNKLVRMVKIGQFKKAASKVHENQYEWNSLIELATRRADKLLDEIIRPPTELWALREKFLKEIFGAAMLWPKPGEIPAVDEEAIAAMFAPKPIELGEELSGI
jgi:hypothetical protein